MSRVILLALLVHLQQQQQQQDSFAQAQIIPEPFEELHSYSIDNPPQPLSPDPLVRYTWSPATTNTSQLQIYRVDRPVRYDVTPPTSVTGADSLDPKFANQDIPLDVVIHANGSIRFDWGIERAAWFEFTSPNLDNYSSAWTVTASVSEYNVPQKTKPLTPYGTTGKYRLETNPELYEGVRFTWLHFAFSSTQQQQQQQQQQSSSWNLTGVSLVAKIKPIGYVGSFASGDDRLTESWYTGVYGVRLNMEADQFNTVLVERGDRVSILGTNHPVMATSLVAFDGRFATDFVHHELERTNSGSAHGHHVVDDSIIIYPIYWTLSVNDWFMASGDVQGFLKLAPDVMSIIDKRVNDFLSPTLNIVWMAWDDRLGDGWCTDGLAQGDSCGLEAHLTFAAIVVRACWDLGRSLHLAGSIQDGDRYQATARHLGAILRQQIPNWPYGLGVHSAAHIINAGFAIDQSQDEMDALFDQYLNNSVTICSQCNFDQYWVLQGLTNANRMEHALASVNLCWGTSRALGKGCFWEMYSPFWASLMEDGDQAPIGISFCHPWAAGVSAWLSHQVGGVQPLLPGYEEVMLVPFVSPNYSFVETAVPIPDGVISVTAKLSQGRVVINVNSTKPGFIGVRLLLAGSNTRANGACVLDVQGVSIDDKSVQVNSLAEIAAAESALVQTALYQHVVPNVASSFMFLRTPHGYHTIVANYTGGCRPNSAAVPTTAAPPTRMSKPGIPHFPPFPVPSYPARTQMDRVSAGNGLTYYGADGYLLFGNSEDGSNLYKLPTYVRNVTVHRHNYFGWKELAGVFVGKSTTNGTYLPDADSKSKNRTLGMVGVDDQELGRGIIIDVDVVDGEHDGNFTVSLYAVAGTSS